MMVVLYCMDSDYVKMVGCKRPYSEKGCQYVRVVASLRTEVCGYVKIVACQEPYFDEFEYASCPYKGVNYTIIRHLGYFE